MLTAERRQHILATLQRDGKVLASELSAELGVSEDTIRRDLRELADASLLQRVHVVVRQSNRPVAFSGWGGVEVGEFAARTETR